MGIEFGKIEDLWVQDTPEKVSVAKMNEALKELF